MPSGSRLVASRCTRGHCRTIASAVLAHPPIRCSQLSSHDQHILQRQGIQQRLQRRPARLGGQPQRLRDGRRHRVLVGDRGQLRQPHPVPGPIQQLGRHLQPQPGLAAPAGPGQGDQPRRFHQRPDLGHLPVPADERRQLGGQIVRQRRVAQRPQRREPGRRPAAVSWKIRSGRPRSFSRCTPRSASAAPGGSPSRTSTAAASDTSTCPPWRDRGHPGGPVHLQAYQPSRCPRRLPAMDPHPHPHPLPARPGMRQSPAASPAPPPRTPAARRTPQRIHPPACPPRGRRARPAPTGSARDARPAPARNRRPQPPEQRRRTLNVGEQVREGLHPSSVERVARPAALPAAAQSSQIRPPGWPMAAGPLADYPHGRARSLTLPDARTRS